ncbi:uncharacterized protein BJX67DRAFT_75663 [Aspergillus lucknowensis]|uniref:Uncharacterized protein n=1 Tax=Aspergillus lucknowensis TaxID=176173 RepID=A0ABR4LSX3_9EURO
MRTLAEDAQNVRNCLGSSIGRIIYPSSDPYPISRYWWSPIAWTRLIENIFNQLADSWRQTPQEYPSKPLIRAVAGMLSNIKSTALDYIDPPLEYTNVFLTWPDFEASTGHIYQDLFQVACQFAGLDYSGGNIVSMYSLKRDGVRDDADEYSGTNSSSMLVVSYNSKSLGITLNTRSYGYPWPDRLLESPQHGAEKNNGSMEYRNEVERLLKIIVGDDKVDHLLLLGSHAHDAVLLGVIREFLQSHTSINSSLLDRYKSSTSDSRQDGSRPLFTAAREAATVARRDIEARFQRCEEANYCEEDEEEDAYDMRSEL